MRNWILRKSRNFARLKNVWRNRIFPFSLNQLRPKLHSKYYGRNPEMRESPNLGKHPIKFEIVHGFTLRGSSQALYNTVEFCLIWKGVLEDLQFSHTLKMLQIQIFRVSQKKSNCKKLKLHQHFLNTIEYL